VPAAKHAYLRPALYYPYIHIRDERWLHDPSAYGHREWYAPHPTLGSAVMTTLGLSIARDEHYDIVTPNAKYHETLLATDEAELKRTLLDGPMHAKSTTAQARHELAQLTIALTDVNYKAITPDIIAKLQASPHLERFQRAIRDSAVQLETKRDPEECQETLSATAEAIIDGWKETKNDLLNKLKVPLITTGAALSGMAIKAQLGTAWKSGKPKNGFPLFHPAHATTMMVLSLNPKPKKGRRPLRALLILLSRSRSGRAARFHAHLSIGKCCGPRKGRCQL
jgi:hypothetical protein